ILEDLTLFDKALPAKVALFKVFHSIWSTSGASFADADDGLAAKAHAHLSKLTSDTREALLLHSIEDLGYADVATILGVSTEEAQSLTDIAIEEMSKSLASKVLVIEDEAIIALDLEGIVAAMGHRVTGVARTATAAIELYDKEEPGLILSDIQLADGSSGIDAISKITEKGGQMPVIFVTAYPERLLTGEGSEPTFLIPKPYTEDQVRTAVSQALFFSSTDSLQG
ncbi:MAG: response regulator, partial [Pseudomonadota bacterium]